MSRKSSFDDDAGFTLIEALVALAIVATVLAPVGAMIATTVKGTRSIDQRLALAGTAETLLSLDNRPSKARASVANLADAWYGWRARTQSKIGRALISALVKG